MPAHFRGQTYVSEFHPTTGEMWLRASCSRHKPTWNGEWLRLSGLMPMLLNGQRRDLGSIIEELKAAAMAAAFEHADRFHRGALT